MKEFINKKGLVDLEHCFLKCKASFQTCMKIEENKYLLNEIKGSNKGLILKNDSVKIIIDHEAYGESIIDVRINLLNIELDEIIGHYRYIENLEGDPLDDFLFFI